MIPRDDMNLPERLARKEMDCADLADAREALAEAKKKGTISLAAAKRELEL